MNDVLIEQLVKKKWEIADTVKAALIALAAFIVMGLSVLLIYTDIYVLIFPIFVGVSYLASRLITNLSVEFEYSFVNGSLTVDKIINKRSRKSIVTVTVRNFERFTKYDSEKISQESCNSFLHAAECAVPAEGRYAVFNRPGIGRTVLVFSPNEKLTQAITSYLKGEVRIESLSE